MKPTLAAILIGLAMPTAGFAFGPTGHRAIGLIAERHLTDSAQQGVRRLLGSASLAEVSTWADEIRSDPAWRHASAWHFVTIEDGQTYESSAKNPAGDIVEAIERFVLILRDPHAPRNERAEALKWLVHLVGDVHQPLHVGRGEDRGGNRITTRWFGEETNLHAIWDEKLIDSTRLSFTELAAFIHTDDAEQVARWRQSEVADWVRESFELRAQAYVVPTPTTTGSYQYSHQNMPLVKQRLAQAGVRLADLLNRIFVDHAAE